MFGSDSYLMSAYHNKPKSDPSLALTTQSKPFAGFQQQQYQIKGSNRPPLLPKSEPTSAEFESTIAQLWKSNNNDRFTSSDDIWKFSPGNQSNPLSDYSSGLSESSPDDHAETFFNVASQLQRQTPPDQHQQLRSQHSNNDLADFFKPFDTAEHTKPLEYKPESLVKNSLCCQFILDNRCDRGLNCSFAHNIMQIGQPI